MAVSYALEEQVIHLSKKPALPVVCEKLSEAQSELGNGARSAWTLGLRPLQWYQGCSCCCLHLQNNSSLQRERFPTPALSSPNSF